MPRNVHRACNDFHQTSEAVRRTYLGSDASSDLTRRQIIGRGLAAGLAVYAAQAMPLTRVLEAASAEAQAAPNAPILVSVFLPGGCDLLDTIVPQSQYGQYADLRPSLKLGGDIPALGGTGLGLNPALATGTGGGVKGLFDSGKVGFLPGIDYSNPDLSHFHSRHFWETGLVTQNAASGWLGRFLDRNGSGDNPLQGVSMSNALSPVLRTGGAPVAAVSSPNAAQFWIPDVWGKSFDDAMAAWAQIAQRGAGSPGEAAAVTSARLTKEVADRLAPYKSDESKGIDPLAGSVAYPENNELGERLKNLAGLLSQPLGIRVATVESEGDFDTHDRQRDDHTRGLEEISQALGAFQADIEARGLGDRVLTFVWSEFGRRAEQNDSAGTDHGAGGFGFVMGTRAKSGILSDYPDLKRLDDHGNLSVTVDFRRVYCSLLEQWLGVDAGSIIPNAGAFGRLGVVA
jgi:uncharacterized protein (DUF1501 family)